MNVTLVRPPFYSLMGITSASHPLAIGYLSACLVKNGHNVSVVDTEVGCPSGSGLIKSATSNIFSAFFPHLHESICNNRLVKLMNSPDGLGLWSAIAENIVSKEPKMIGITCFTQSMSIVRKVVIEIKKRLPDACVVLGGIHPTCLQEKVFLEIPEADVLVIGEGEETVVDLVNELEKPIPSFNQVPGIIFRNKDGLVVKTSIRRLIDDLDDIPLPTRRWQGLDYERHLGMTSRGCPYACKFCASKCVWTRKVRYASIDRVMAELNHVNQLGVSFFRYSDDTFTLNRKRVSQWCDEVKATGFNRSMAFGFGTRVELIDKKVVDEYASAGVVNISFGIETGSNRVSSVIGKKFKILDPVERVKMVNDVGITTRTYFMFGHPTERIEDAEATINMIRKMVALPRNYVEINIVCPYPKTELWSTALSYNDDKEFVNIDSYYKLFHQATPIVNLTDMDEDTLVHFIRMAKKIATISVLKSRISLLQKQFFFNPFRVIRFAKNYFGR